MFVTTCDSEGFENHLLVFSLQTQSCNEILLMIHQFKLLPFFCDSDEDLNGGDVLEDTIYHNAKSHHLLSWSERTSEGSPDLAAQISEHQNEQEEEEEEHNQDFEDKNQEEIRVSYHLSPDREADEEEWSAPPSLTKVNGIHHSPSPPADDALMKRLRIGQQLHEDALSAYMNRNSAGTFMEEYGSAREFSDSEEELQTPRMEERGGVWGPGLVARRLELDRARLNLSLLEQAMVLQSEHRHVLHSAYKDMDRFLLEQMNHERRQQRMLEIDARAMYHSSKGEIHQSFITFSLIFNHLNSAKILVPQWFNFYGLMV